MTDQGATAAAAAYSAVEAVVRGQVDPYLAQIATAIRARQRLLHNLAKSPPASELEPGQVWVQMNGPGKPHWEIRGTGLRNDSADSGSA